MLVKVLGYNDYSFTTKVGDVIEGTKIFYAYPYEGVVGLKCDELTISAQNRHVIPDDLKPNDNLDLFFDNKGRIESIIKK